MANITATDLIINGVKMPDLLAGGLTQTSEKLWSQDTGRTASGGMVGNIIAIIRKCVLKWPPLTMDEVATIETAVSNADAPFPYMVYTDPTGRRVTVRGYFGTPSYTIDTYDQQIVTDVTVDFIEKGGDS